MAFARYKDKPDMPWQAVTNMHMPFAAEKGILDYMIEKMQERHPDIEYITKEMKREPKQTNTTQTS
jgi:hypothetical protein